MKKIEKKEELLSEKDDSVLAGNLQKLQSKKEKAKQIKQQKINASPYGKPVSVSKPVNILKLPSTTESIEPKK